MKQSQAIVFDIVSEMWKYICNCPLIHQYFVGYLLKSLCWLALLFCLVDPLMLCDPITQGTFKDIKSHFAPC